MSKSRILVTSAAGHTGAAAVKELLAKGFQVRAFVRQNDVRSEALKAQGAEIFVGNLFDINDLRQALKGVQRAYHCPPFGPNLLHCNMLFAIAAEESRLEAVVILEAWNAHPGHPSDITREHWMSRQIVAWMPSVESVHIAPGFFAFTYFFDVQTIRNLGLLLLPFGDSQNAPPSNEDIGAMVAAVVAEPADHVGKVYRPTGPELLTPSDVAKVCGRILGRTVRYRNVSTRMFTKAATALGVSPFEITHLRHFVEEHRGGTFATAAPTSDVELVTGRPPEPFEDTARRYLEIRLSCIEVSMSAARLERLERCSKRSLRKHRTSMLLNEGYSRRCLTTRSSHMRAPSGCRASTSSKTRKRPSTGRQRPTRKGRRAKTHLNRWQRPAK